MKVPSVNAFKTFVGMGLLVLSAFMTMIATAATDVRSVAPDGTFTIAASDTFAKTQGSTSNENVLYFEGDGTLKVTGSGAVCKTGFAILATNGTLTVDLSGFTFTDQSKKVYWPMGGLLCNVNGQLNVSGVDTVLLGASSTGPGEPVYTLDDVNLGGAELVLTNRVALGAMPSRATVPWKVASNIIYLSAFGVDLSELCDANGNLDPLPATTLSVARTASFDKVKKVGVAKGQTLRVYMSGFYKALNITTSAGVATTIQSPFSWGGQVGYTFKPDIELKDATACLDQELRGAVYAGKITGNGYVTILGSKVTTSRSDFFVFSNEVNVAELKIRGDTARGPKYKATVEFCESCTLGKLTMTDDTTVGCSTNIRLRIAKDVALTVTGETQLSEASAEVPYADRAQIEFISSGASANLGSVVGGVASVRGAGTLSFASLGKTATVYVHPEATVADGVPGVYLEETVDDPVAGTVVRAYQSVVPLNGKTGTLDLLGSGPVTLVAEPGESDAVVKLNGTTARVETEETGWNDNDNIIAWFDFSDESTWHQIMTTWDPPTTDQAKWGVFLDGDQKMAITVDGVSCPLLESVADCRGGDFTAYRLYNNRMYKPGTNEFWASVYPYAFTNESSLVNGHAFVEFGTTENKSCRLAFTPAIQKPASITYVFNPAYGGGTAPIHDIRDYFGREKGADSAILSNNTCDVWINGVKVADPTTEKFPAGWCVVTLQPKSSYQNTNLDRIGATNAQQLNCGHQMGEVVVMSKRPTDGQRYALEARLAKKWGIPNVPLSDSSLAVKGSGTVDFAGDVTLGSATEGAGLTYAGAADIVLKSAAALPASFADTFDGVATLDFPSLSFTLNGTSVSNPLDVTPAKLSVPGEMNILLDGSGSGELDLITCGGFVGEPTWTLGDASRGKLMQDATTLKLRCRIGAIIFFR